MLTQFRYNYLFADLKTSSLHCNWIITKDTHEVYSSNVVIDISDHELFVAVSPDAKVIDLE